MLHLVTARDCLTAREGIAALEQHALAAARAHSRRCWRSMSLSTAAPAGQPPLPGTGCPGSRHAGGLGARKAVRTGRIIGRHPELAARRVGAVMAPSRSPT